MTVKAFFAKPFVRPIAEWCNLPQFFRHARVLEMRIGEFVDAMRLPEFFLYRTVADVRWKPPGSGRLRWTLEIPEVGILMIEWQMVDLVAKTLEIQVRKMDQILGKV